MIHKEVILLNSGRATIPVEFRKKMGISTEGAVVFEYDDKKKILSVKPYETEEIKCCVTGDILEVAEAIPLVPNDNIFISRRALISLFKKYIGSKIKTK